MKEKIKAQKGFIHIPLLIIIIASIVAVSVGTSVFLHKQRKLAPLSANISEVFEKTCEVATIEKIELEESQINKLEISQEEINQQKLEKAKLEIERAKQEAEAIQRLTDEKRQREITKQQALEQSEQIIENIAKKELLFNVVKVVDGDTIKLENGEVVRYIGIDTPETVNPSKPIQCFGKEASNKNKELVEGKLIKLEKDITDRDKYGRLLGYVWAGDLFVNDYLVRHGYAYAYTYPPDVMYSEQFIQAQREAKENNRGLWAGCFEQEVVEETPSPLTESIPPKEATTCSHNTYNCSDFSTHAEAQGVFDYCGGITNDIHRLDADKDGLACESLP